jgi:hypothetical protein
MLARWRRARTRRHGCEAECGARVELKIVGSDASPILRNLKTTTVRLEGCPWRASARGGQVTEAACEQATCVECNVDIPICRRSIAIYSAAAIKHHSTDAGEGTSVTN